MSEAKFTPGPWSILFGRERKLIMSDDPSCGCVAEAFKYAGGDDLDGIANAHLIAAAPELYAMLAEIVDDGEISLHQIVRAEKALAKARGEV